LTEQGKGRDVWPHEGWFSDHCTATYYSVAAAALYEYNLGEMPMRKIAALTDLDEMRN
jgi:hypothetical protein